MKYKPLFGGVLGAIIFTIGVSFFLAPHNMYPGGFSGISLILTDIIKTQTGINIPFGVSLLFFNVPLFIFGWFKIGKDFTVYTMITVASITIISSFIPVQEATNNQLLACVFGGVISGVGIGITLKSGCSQGGNDIIGTYLSVKKNMTMGTYFLAFNIVIITFASFYFDFERGLYTMISMYVSSVVIDKMYNRLAKYSLQIIVKKDDEIKVIEELNKRLGRGITKMNGVGAFTNQDKVILFTVISGYEMNLFKEALHESKVSYFVNVAESKDIIGNFKVKATDFK